MHLIICVDDNLGMMFNHRRVSSDRDVAAAILEMASGSTLYMSPYSLSFFSDVEQGEDLVITPACLARAKQGDYCFVEDGDPSAFEDSIETLTIFRWNRRYPSDRKLKLDMSRFEPISTEEFPGYSHEKITKEVYNHV